MTSAPKLAPGETATTIHGWETTPFPRCDFTTNRKAAATLKRIEVWLIDNGRRAAVGTPMAHGLANEVPGRLPPATKDALATLLFGMNVI